MIIHIRHNRKKIGGNQFYLSKRYDGKIGTLCGAAMTDKDLSIKSVLQKSFNRKEHEKLMGVTICSGCLKLLEGQY